MSCTTAGWVAVVEGGRIHVTCLQKHFSGVTLCYCLPGSVARVGREETAEDCEMWADLDSVQNSKVEAVPIIQYLELSINDSMSPVISFISGDILTIFDRTTN